MCEFYDYARECLRWADETQCEERKAIFTLMAGTLAMAALQAKPTLYKQVLDHPRRPHEDGHASQTSPHNYQSQRIVPAGGLPAAASTGNERFSPGE
jgi:hypothetical protein